MSSLCVQCLCPLTRPLKDITEGRFCVLDLPYWRPKTTCHWSATITRRLQRSFPTSPLTSLASPPLSTTTFAPVGSTWLRTGCSSPQRSKLANTSPRIWTHPPVTACQWASVAPNCRWSMVQVHILRSVCCLYSNLWLANKRLILNFFKHCFYNRHRKRY